MTTSQTADVEVTVIGAGVVGVAIARQLAKSGKDVLLLEKADRIGTETSSRNSEVIHAGIYYTPNSLKAKMCVSGKQKLYNFCKEFDVNHKNIGKLIVATHQDQIPSLHSLHQRALQNGVSDLKLLDQYEATAMEPYLSCVKALLSPSTGIVDSHQCMSRLHDDFERYGGTTALCSTVVKGFICTASSRKTLVVHDSISGIPTEIITRNIVNAAGLHSQTIAKNLFVDANSKTPLLKSIPRLIMAKGSYFTLKNTPGSKQQPPFSHLIYPLPTKGGLGIHYTVDLGKGVRFGPNVEWLPLENNPMEIDYSVDPEMGAVFEESVRQFYPGIGRGSLVPSYAGVRPKAVNPTTNELIDDFVISNPLDGIVCLYGIESPGLTSCLSIAEEVERILV